MPGYGALMVVTVMVVSRTPLPPTPHTTTYGGCSHQKYLQHQVAAGGSFMLDANKDGGGGSHDGFLMVFACAPGGQPFHEALSPQGA